MVLMRKFRTIPIMDKEGEDDNDVKMQDLGEAKSKTEYLIQAVIRKKILFNQRPKPIVF